jgi:integrase
MATSKQLIKVEKNLDNISTPNIENYFGLNADMLKAVIAEALKQNNLQKVLGIQKFENGGEKRKYYLIKRPSKKLGYVYQIKLIDPDTNDILPTKFSTGTNDYETAVMFAERNYKTLLKQYGGKAGLKVFETYYSDTGEYWKFEKYDGRKLSPLVMKHRNAFMVNHIIPFFQSKNIRSLSQITPIHIKELKNYLSVEQGLTPQTINNNLNSFKKCLLLFRDIGKITTDFSKCDFCVKGSKEAEKARGIFPIDTLKGVFTSNKWKSNLYKILCQIIYFTGIRNSELLRIQFNDIQKINDLYFLNVRGTKSKNAKRKVPIHNTLYKALNTYIKENDIKEDIPIFKGLYNDVFRQASFEMGNLLGFTENQLLEKGICFYSGRHTFKTILAIGNLEKIADIPIDFQELFMGHPFREEKINKGKKGIKEYSYKHLDSESIGNDLLYKKGIEVIKILDYFFF